MVNADLTRCIRWNGRTYGPVLVVSCSQDCDGYIGIRQKLLASPITIHDPMSSTSSISQFWVRISRFGLELGTHFFSLLVDVTSALFHMVIHRWFFHVCVLYWWKPFICASFICIYIYSLYLYIMMPTKYGIYQLFTWRESYTNLSRNCFIYTTSIHYIRHTLNLKASHPALNPTHLSLSLSLTSIN